MSAIVTKVVNVTPFGENLSQVDLENGMFVIANRQEDGSFRWQPGETCVYVSENSVVPDEVLKDRGYWNEEKGIGLLAGKKGNKVKGRNFGPEDDRRRSVGLLFKCYHPGHEWSGEKPIDAIGFVSNPHEGERASWLPVCRKQDVSDFFGITE